MTVLLRNIQRIVPVSLARLKADVEVIQDITGTQSFDLGVLCVDTDYIRELNKTYRNKDAPTDVLSFPFHQMTPGDLPAITDDDEANLGDIFLGLPYINERCCMDKTDLHDMLTILITHGMCHLLGHDHMDLHSWQCMLQREKTILEKYNALTGRNLHPVTEKPASENEHHNMT